MEKKSRTNLFVRQKIFPIKKKNNKRHETIAWLSDTSQVSK